MRRRSRFVFRQRNLTPGLLRTFQGSDVPFQSGKFRSFYRRSPENSPVGIFIHLLQPFVIERQKFIRRIKTGSVVRPGIPVPGTDNLTDITTVYIVTQTRNNLGRNFPFVFNGLIRYALPGVHPVRFFNGSGRTGVQATTAFPAIL